MSDRRFELSASGFVEFVRLCMRDQPRCLAIAYLVLGLLWIYGIGILIESSWGSSLGSGLSLYSGTFFVVVTAFVFYRVLSSRLTALRQAIASHYEYVVKYANDIFLLVEAEQPRRIIEANERAFRAYGYSREELIGMPAADLRAAEAREQVDSDVARYFSDQTGALYESLHRRKDGATFPVEISGRMVEIGGRDYLQVVVRDISERKRSEAALLAGKQRLATLLDSIPDPAWLKDHQGRYLAANQAFAKVLRMDVARIVGKTATDLFPLPLASKFSANEGFVAVNGKSSIMEDTFDSPSGRRWYETTVLSIPDEEDGWAGTAGIAHDVTDRKLVEQERQRKTKELEDLLENIPDSIARHDRETRYLYGNRMARELAALAGIDVMGKPIREVGLPAGITRHLEEKIAAVFASRELCRFESELRLSSGVIMLDILLQPEFATDGQVSAVLGIARDVTAYKRLEAQQQHHELQLHELLVETIHAMALTVEKRDPYTAGHQGRTALLAVAIGEELGLSELQIEGLRLGGMIHDIGKIYIPSEILNRPGRLSEQEMALIRTHPEVGYDIIKDIHFVWPVKEVVLQHHERMDGSGYPHGLKGDEIALEARIVAVADVVEAVSSHRPYRPSLGMERSLEEIRSGRGTRYDPGVVDACLKLFTENRFVFKSD